MFMLVLYVLQVSGTKVESDIMTVLANRALQLVWLRIICKVLSKCLRSTTTSSGWPLVVHIVWHRHHHLPPTSR